MHSASKKPVAILTKITRGLIVESKLLEEPETWLFVRLS
jgi:hypothetical protein